MENLIAEYAAKCSLFFLETNTLVRNYHLDFFHQCLNPQISTCGRLFNVNKFRKVLASTSWETNAKMSSWWNFSIFKSQFCSKSTGWIYPNHSSVQNSLLASFSTLLFSWHQMNRKMPEVPLVLIFHDCQTVFPLDPQPGFLLATSQKKAA